MAQFLLDFTRSARADESSVQLPEGDTEYQLRGRGQSRPDLAELRWSPRLREQLDALRAHAEAAIGESAARVGRILADFVAVPGWAAASQEIVALGEREPCTLTVRSNASEIYLLPWELLSVGSIAHAGFLPKLLVRYEWPDTRTAPRLPGLSRSQRGRVVFAWSAAGGKVDAAQHTRVIERSLDAAAGTFDEAPDRALDVVAHASCAAIRERLERAKAAGEPVAVLHVLCHGGCDDAGTFGLILSGEDDPDARDLVSPSRLQQLLLPYAGLVRLVVISACDGGNAGPVGHELGSVAQTLHRAGFGAVIASRFPLSWEGAGAFAERLYEKLLRELTSLEEAFVASRVALAGRSSYDWASLQLYAREADGDATFVFQARPYRGLSAFSPEHARFFFGRDREVDELVRDLDALVAAKKPRFMVVSGASGTGKSSMVMAGAIPLWARRIPDGRFAWLVARPGAAPAEVFKKLDERRELIAASERFLLVVDQLEELFTHVDRAAASAFVRELWERASEPGSKLCVLATLRLDFLARCAELGLDDGGLRFDKVACDPDHQVLVPQMSPAQLREAIERPALSAGLAMEANLAEIIVRDVGAEPGALPLMSHALYLLWLGREGPVLTRAAYQQLGAVQGALNTHASGQLAALGDDAERETARRLMVRLVHASTGGAPDTRRRRAVDDLRPQDPAERERFERVLRRLVDARLFATGEAAGGRQTVEVAHEALIRHWGQLRGWIDAERAKLARLDQLDEWVGDWKSNPDALLAGSRLGYAEELATKHGGDLSPDARKLIDDSVAERRRREDEVARSRTQRRAVVLGGFVTMAVFLAVALVLFVRARDAEGRAERDREAARAGEARARVASAAATASEVQSAAAVLRTRGETPGFELQNLVNVLNFRTHVAESGVDPLPAALDGALLQTAFAVHQRLALEGHEGPVHTAEFSPDGARVVSAAIDGTAALWDARGGHLVRRFEVHVGEVLRATFTRDGTRIATAGSDGTARLWDAREGGLLATLREGDGPVYDVAFSPDGTQVVTAHQDGKARVWDALSGARIRDLRGHARAVTRVAFSPDGRLIATASSDGACGLWDSRSGEGRAELGGHTGRVVSVAFSRDGARVVTTSSDATARVWDTRSGRAISAIEGHEGEVHAAVFSADGEVLFTASQDGEIGVWAAATGELITILRGHSDAVLALGLSPDGGTLVSASRDRTARLWNAVTRRAVAVLEGHSNHVHDARFSPDGHALVTASADGTVRLWGDRGNVLGARFIGHRGRLDAARFSPDGTLVVTASADGTARIWNAATGALQIALHANNAVRDARFSPDGSHVATVNTDGETRVFNVRAGTVARTLAATPGGAPVDPASVLFSSDGARVFVACGGTARIWTWGTETSGVTLRSDVEGMRVTSLSASSDGAHLVTSSRDGTARVWDAHTGASVSVMRRDDDASPMRHAIFSPDGARVATASERGRARLWDTRTGAMVAELKRDAPLVWLAFSPDGATLAAASSDTRVYLLDGRTAAWRTVLQGHRAPLNTLRFSPDGSRLVTASDDGTARYWDMRGRSLLATLDGHTGAVVAAEFSHDGRQVLTASTDGSARRWELDVNTALRSVCELVRGGVHWRGLEGVRVACGDPRVLPAAPTPPAAVEARASNTAFSSDPRAVADTAPPDGGDGGDGGDHERQRRRRRRE